MMIAMRTRETSYLNHKRKSLRRQNLKMIKKKRTVKKRILVETRLQRRIKRSVELSFKKKRSSKSLKNASVLTHKMLHDTTTALLT